MPCQNATLVVQYSVALLICLHCKQACWTSACSCTLCDGKVAVCDSVQVLAFFAEQGMSLRERPPLLLVDGPTLQADHGEDYDEEDADNAGKTHSSEEAPVFHITGLCKSKIWGRVNHVIATQKGYSALHKQPSLDATLRPADLSARKVEVSPLCFSCMSGNSIAQRKLVMLCAFASPIFVPSEYLKW